jgi:uncharacterized protein YuzE
MRITFDRSVNAAYISLQTGVEGRSLVSKSYMCGASELDGIHIALDFDAEDRLLGIEVLGATDHLPEELLRDAEIIG